MFQSWDVYLNMKITNNTKNEKTIQESYVDDKKMVKNEVNLRGNLKKVAIVSGNRPLNKNNVKKHVLSLEKFGRNLVRLLYVDAKDAIGNKIYDAQTGELVPEESYGDYIVIMDGQHRYAAALELASRKEDKDFSLDNLTWDKVDLRKHSFQQVLIEVNTRTQPWKGSDYISGCVLNNPTNDVAAFAKELTDLGISAKTVNKYLFFEDKFKWSDAMEDSEVLEKADMSRALKIWEEVKQFPDKIRKKSLIIDYIISEGGKKHWEDELNRISNLSEEDIKEIEKVKGAEAQRQLLREKLA